jgi:release factor glutamine methyltransferase
VKALARALDEAARGLSETSDTPRLDAELLMAEAFGIDRDILLLKPPARAVPARFAEMIERRRKGEPVAYITGRRAFWTIELCVGPGALIPRPDSETLIEAALDHFGKRGPATILDLGTGPGTLLLAALAQWPEAHGLGVDSSERALEYAEDNALHLDLEERARFKLGDWARDLRGQFDLILCNPPYVERGAGLPRDVTLWEPSGALFAGEDGLSEYRRLAPEIPRLLAHGGLACFELGAGQRDAVASLFEAEGFIISSRRDLKGIERCLVLSR